MKGMIKGLREVMSMPVKWVYLMPLILFLSGGFYFFYPKIENFFIFFP